MRTKVEILRAIEYTILDLENITNLDEIDDFSDKDREFMESFKKIYEYGLNQLEFFINKLDEEGEDLDTYSIQYYVSLLLNGPLGNYARKLGEGKNYFVNTPDSMGMLGNILKSYQNTTVLQGLDNPLGCAVDVFNKLPQFMQMNLDKSVAETEDVFRSSLKSSTVNDNTMPIVDKKPQERYTKEPTGELVITANGNMLVKDSFYLQVLDTIGSDIYDLVLDYLNEENFRLFMDNKEYNPFDSEKNTSTSKHYKLNRVLEGKQEIEVDLLGNTIESISRRESSIKIETDTISKEFDLSTNEGQLGH